jgi:hypothetical protein
MNEKVLNEYYISAIRSRKKSGARWQKVTELRAKRMATDAFSPIPGSY